jgi:hypothetical protein
MAHPLQLSAAFDPVMQEGLEVLAPPLAYIVENDDAPPQLPPQPTQFSIATFPTVTG